MGIAIETTAERVLRDLRDTTLPVLGEPIRADVPDRLKIVSGRPYPYAGVSGANQAFIDWRDEQRLIGQGGREFAETEVYTLARRPGSDLTSLISYAGLDALYWGLDHLPQLARLGLAGGLLLAAQHYHPQDILRLLKPNVVQKDPSRGFPAVPGTGTDNPAGAVEEPVITEPAEDPRVIFERYLAENVITGSEVEGDDHPVAIVKEIARAALMTNVVDPAFLVSTALDRNLVSNTFVPRFIRSQQGDLVVDSYPRRGLWLLTDPQTKKGLELWARNIVLPNSPEYGGDLDLYLSFTDRLHPIDQTHALLGLWAFGSEEDRTQLHLLQDSLVIDHYQKLREKYQDPDSGWKRHEFKDGTFIEYNVQTAKLIAPPEIAEDPEGLESIPADQVERIEGDEVIEVRRTSFIDLSTYRFPDVPIFGNIQQALEYAMKNPPAKYPEASYGNPLRTAITQDVISKLRVLAAAYGMDEDEVLTVLGGESGYYPNAISNETVPVDWRASGIASFIGSTWDHVSGGLPRDRRFDLAVNFYMFANYYPGHKGEWDIEYIAPHVYRIRTLGETRTIQY